MFTEVLPSLCMTPGTGKTFIIIGLILATLQWIADESITLDLYEGLETVPEQGTTTRRRANAPPRAPARLTPSKATLIVVPINIFQHWTREINKSCEKGVLKVYELGHGENTVCSVGELSSQYDVSPCLHGFILNLVNGLGLIDCTYVR